MNADLALYNQAFDLGYSTAKRVLEMADERDVKFTHYELFEHACWNANSGSPINSQGFNRGVSIFWLDNSNRGIR